MFDFGWQTYALLGGGLLFVILEVFFPSGGLLGIGATICLGVGAWTAFEYGGGFSAVLKYGASVVVLAPITLVFAFKILPHTPFANAIILQPSGTPQVATELGLESLVGQRGRTITDLRPAGIALVADRRVDVVTRGVHLEAGDDVRIVKVEGNRVIVEHVGGEPT